MPFAFCNLKLNRQYVIAKNPRWLVVLIGNDRWQRFSAKASCNNSKAQQKDRCGFINPTPANVFS